MSCVFCACTEKATGDSAVRVSRPCLLCLTFLSVPLAASSALRARRRTTLNDHAVCLTALYRAMQSLTVATRLSISSKWPCTKCLRSCLQFALAGLERAATAHPRRCSCPLFGATSTLLGRSGRALALVAARRPQSGKSAQLLRLDGVGEACADEEGSSDVVVGA